MTAATALIICAAAWSGGWTSQALAGQVRLYEHIDGQGSALVYNVFDSMVFVPVMPDHWNDRISFVWAIDADVTLYEHGPLFGSVLRLGPGRYNLPGLGWNDRVSSMKFQPVHRPSVYLDAPTGAVNRAWADIAFQTIHTEFGAFQTSCSQDQKPFVPCQSPWRIDGLNDGEHSVAVRVIDAWGHSSVSDARWVVDTTPPSVTITRRPNPLTSETAATFAFQSAGASRVECALDGANVPCQAGQTLVYGKLRDGGHVFRVRADDAAGNPAVAEALWTVDTLPPSTRITAQPPALTSEHKVQITFQASEAASFVCSLNGGTANTCSSPWVVEASAPGPHVASIRARDAAGNIELSPPLVRWTTGVDADGDRSLVPVDCDDADPARHPGAAEIPGNDVDEDCDGVDAPVPSIAATVRAAWHTKGAKARLLSLHAFDLPAGARVTVTCRLHKRACLRKPFRLGVDSSRAQLRLRPRFDHHWLPRGTKLNIVLSKQGWNGKSITYTVRRGRAPDRVEACVPPNGTSRCGGAS